MFVHIIPPSFIKVWWTANPRMTRNPRLKPSGALTLHVLCTSFAKLQIRSQLLAGIFRSRSPENGKTLFPFPAPRLCVRRSRVGESDRARPLSSLSLSPSALPSSQHPLLLLLLYLWLSLLPCPFIVQMLSVKPLVSRSTYRILLNWTALNIVIVLIIYSPALSQQ